MSNVHDHLWIDIFQHTYLVEQDEKRIWKYRHHLIFDACKHGYIRAVRAVIASSADVNQQENDGRTPLWIASWMGYIGVVKVLLAAGADVNQQENDGRTPLYIASLFDHVEAVNILIVAGANVNTRTNYGRTPIDVSNDNIRKILLAAGAIE